MSLRVVIILIPAIIILLAAIATASPPIPTNYQISLPSFRLQNEEQIQVCPTDSLYLAASWRDHRVGFRQVAVGSSTDGGNTWTSNVVPLTLSNQGWQSDPTMDVDKSGNFYMSFLDIPTVVDEPWEITLLKSTDKGVTWMGPYTITDSRELAADKQFVAIDKTDNASEGNIYVAWAAYDNDNVGQMAFCRSVDGGLNFSPLQLIETYMDFSFCGGLAQNGVGQFAEPFVGHDGSVYVSYCSKYLDSSDCSEHDVLKLVKSSDEGISFTDPKIIQFVHGNYSTVDGGVDVITAPSSAVDISGGPYTGNLYLLYASADPTNKDYFDYNINLIKSSDGGDNWAEPIYINDDHTGPGSMYDQFLPWMAINQEGTLVAIWYDQRTDPVEHNNFDVFVAYSFDGGQSFTTNHRISEVSVDPDNLSVSRAGLIAEYIGVTVFKHHVNAIWTDTRNGDQDVFGANWVIPLMKPRLLAPRHGNQTFSTPAMNWATTWKENDDQYLLEVATDLAFTNVIISETLTSPEFTTATPLADGQYYWRVQATIISTAEVTDYSAIDSFVVDTYLPPIPTLISPADGTISLDDDPTFEWELGAEPTSDVLYNLLISPDETFADEDITRRYEGITGTSYTTSDVLYPDTVYYWTVSAENWAGQTEGFAESNSYEYLTYFCADVDGVSGINILDAVFLINYKYKDGPAPDPEIAGDADGIPPVNILDIVYILNSIYKGGPDPICE